MATMLLLLLASFNVSRGSAFNHHCLADSLLASRLLGLFLSHNCYVITPACQFQYLFVRHPFDIVLFQIVSVLPAKEGDAAAAAAAAADPLHLQHDFTFDRAALAAWLQQQREERPQLAFFNLEVSKGEI